MRLNVRRIQEEAPEGHSRLDCSHEASGLQRRLFKERRVELSEVSNLLLVLLMLLLLQLELKLELLLLLVVVLLLLKLLRVAKAWVVARVHREHL